MFGLIMKFNWDGVGGETVPVTIIGSYDALMACDSVDTDREDGQWGRREVVLLLSKLVRTDYGGERETAYLCARRGTDFKAAFAADIAKDIA